MAGMFFYLSRNHNIYSKATDEVRAHFASIDEIRLGEALNSCTYLRACIDECMRISPSVGSSLWREVMAGGMAIDGHHIPAGCEVGTSIYSIHHNGKLWPDPFTFDPERWLTVPTDSRDATEAYIPFSFGPRSCIGKGLALAELTLSMAVVLYTLDFQSAMEAPAISDSGMQNEFQLYDHVTSEKDGPLLRFRMRPQVVT